MKNFISILFVIFISSTIHGQESNLAFQKANTILLITNKKQSEIHFDWGKHLVQNGFEIEKSDKDYFTIKTGLMDLSTNNCDCQFYIFSSVNENGEIKSKIKLRFKTSGIDLIAGGRKYPFYDWEYVDKKKNPAFALYQKIKPIFESFGEHNLVYTKE